MPKTKPVDLFDRFDTVFEKYVVYYVEAPKNLLRFKRTSKRPRQLTARDILVTPKIFISQEYVVSLGCWIERYPLFRLTNIY